MKERPIIMSGESVRAILEGRKTQTRRVVELPAHATPAPGSIHPDGSGHGWIAWWPGPVSAEETVRVYPGEAGFPCPYGRPGDRLWVRETWFELVDPVTSQAYDPPRACYRADAPHDVFVDDGDGYAVLNKDGTERSPWRPSIFMPRWASRLTLEVTEVRVERLQDITEEDVYREGVEVERCCSGYECGCMGLPIEPPAWFFAAAWDRINAARGFPWDSNPWVWVVSFRPLPEESAR